MEGLGLTEHPKPKGRLDLGDKAACAALRHGDCRVRDQSHFGKQGEDLGGGRMTYTQPLKKETP
jgi:hypothetical protein